MNDRALPPPLPIAADPPSRVAVGEVPRRYDDVDVTAIAESIPPAQSAAPPPGEDSEWELPLSELLEDRPPEEVIEARAPEPRAPEPIFTPAVDGDAEWELPQSEIQDDDALAEGAADTRPAEGEAAESARPAVVEVEAPPPPPPVAPAPPPARLTAPPPVVVAAPAPLPAPAPPPAPSAVVKHAEPPPTPATPPRRARMAKPRPAAAPKATAAADAGAPVNTTPDGVDIAALRRALEKARLGADSGPSVVEPRDRDKAPPAHATPAGVTPKPAQQAPSATPRASTNAARGKH